jgi:hypothetical protein
MRAEQAEIIEEGKLMTEAHELDQRCEEHKALGFYYDPCCPFCPNDPAMDHAQRHGYDPRPIKRDTSNNN